MNELVLKQFESNQIRITTDDQGNPWFVAQDVMSVLGIKNQAHALRKLGSNQRGEVPLQGNGGFREFATVSESGLYALIFQSSKREAIAFQSWVTEEVLPSIRKTGSYSIEPKEELSPLDILENHLRHMRRLEAANKVISIQVIQVSEKTNLIDTKVDRVAKTVDNLLTHRSGNDPVPQGTITLPRIRAKYFFGISMQIISEYLAARNHPRVPYTYVTKDGFEQVSYCFTEQGLREAYEELIETSSFVKKTPQKIMMTNPLIGPNFGFKLDELPAFYGTLLLRRIEREVKADEAKLQS